MSNQNAHKPGYKHTPLGWIPEEWEVKEVGEIAKISSGGTPDRKNTGYWNGSIPWISTSLIDFNTITKADQFITEAGLKASSAKMFEPGTILMAMYGQGKTRGKVAKLGIRASTNQACAALIVDKTVNVDFLFQNFLHNYNNIRKLSNTGSQENLNGELIKSINIKLPTSLEQRQIAAILSTWDEAISKTQQLITQLQQRNKGLLQALLRPKTGWKEKKLSEIFERVIRRNTVANNNVVTISARRGFVKQNDFFKKIVASDILDNYFLIHKGEFSYNKSYSNGYDWGAIKRLNNFDEAVVTTLYICFRIKNENVHSGDFFEFFFDACLLDRGLSKIAHEGGRAHGLLNVTPKDFFSLNVCVPNYNEQLRIFNILSVAKSELSLYEQKLATLQRQKKGLMQKLFTGEVRVKLN
ncbi:restriction endonuclease subunit S [Chitinophaga agri]|uniref:Restriction endonuclease subunit S n=1 Tax=Chitinophaga agri TaxID=2703787 RepID=A0A6B9ZG19_9BACT|nr:restriction endonuclease subunit S [Chitinophaga agri]QHS61067.1 restriction endonuclease subunit S [Chitinophaga agri]